MPADHLRTSRWARTAHLVLQAALFLTLVIGLNYLAGSHEWRFDLTRYRRYSLSPETLSYMKDLPRPVHIVVTINGAANTQGVHADSPEIQGLLKEYAHATEDNRDGPITVEYVDVYEDRRKVEKYGIDQPDVLLLICGDKRKALSLSELYHFENKVPKAFVGEPAITGAILEVSSPERKKIYFLVGHGELPGDADPARGISIVLDELRIRNFAVDTLELDQKRAIPEDASLLVAVAPLTPYSPREQELLRQYLGAGAGRLILFLAPGTRSGLDELLLDWNVLVDDDLIFDSGSNNVTEDGDLIINVIQPHPITQVLCDHTMPLRIGAARSVRPLPGISPGGGLTVLTLAATSTTAWGEVSYRQRGHQAYTRGVDIKGLPQMDPANRLGVAVASERTTVRGNLPFSVPAGRLVVFGTGDLISNARITNPGTLPIFLGAVNWAAGRDRQLNIPPRPVDKFQLSLSAGELARLRYMLMLALPGAAGLLGLVVYWTRRI